MALLLICGGLAAGCGGEEKTAADLPGALAYVPRDAFVVALVPTDLEGDQLWRFEKLIGPSLRTPEEQSLRDVAAEIAKDADRDFDRDVAPLLGGELVIAAWGDEEEPNTLIALETPDGDKARDMLRRSDTPADVGRVDGDTLLFSLVELEASVEGIEGRLGVKVPGGLD